MSNFETVSPHDARKPTDADRFVGQRMRLARRELSLTQEALASRLGVTFQQIQKYEAGHSRLSAGRLRDVAIALARPIAWFYEPFETPAEPSATGSGVLAHDLKREARQLVEDLSDTESLKTAVHVLAALARKGG